MDYKNKKCAVFFSCMILMALNPALPLSAAPHADYVIVGVGTAGAVLAKELSDDKKTSVIALHTGSNFTDF